MDFLQWKNADFDDFKFLTQNVCDTSLIGSDSSIVSIFLLQKKYNIQTAIKNDIFFRFYNGLQNRNGYLFPISLNNQNSLKNNEYLKSALEIIFEDSKQRNIPVNFCLLTLEQRNLIEETVTKYFATKKYFWDSTIDDSDYIYEREKLEKLSGKTYHKKKNHVSRFLRTYQSRWEFRVLSLCNICDDILEVSKKWGEEHDLKNNIDLKLEYESIKFAIENKDDFALEGGVLYVDGKPCAMTLASKISDEVLDVHFEKCLKYAADNGAYAAINWCFASSCPTFKYFNREEDMGIEGLRKAKLSYHPQIILSKFYGTIK